MKTIYIILGVLGGLFILGYLLIAGPYNGMVAKEEVVSTSWAQVQNVYQRRLDLIPNLVETVKGAANFEKETLQGVIEARANATKVNINADQLTPENLQAFQASQDGLSSALSRLMVVVERYPDLKATANFSELQSQLEGTENRINVERNKFNESVKDYNTYIRKFPNNFTASIFGFEKKAYFEAAAGADKAPAVKF